jgi:hypothetical protein
MDNCMVQSPGGDVRNLAAIRKMNGGHSVREGVSCVLQQRTLQCCDLEGCDGCVGEIRALQPCYAAYSGNSLSTFRTNPPKVKKSKKGRVTCRKRVGLICFWRKPQIIQGVLWVADSNDVRAKLLFRLMFIPCIIRRIRRKNQQYALIVPLI